MAEIVIKSERELENFICANQRGFIKVLGKSLQIEPERINFVGRQVVVGSANRLDLLYYYDNLEWELVKLNDPDYYMRRFIIVELKFRELRLEDLVQVARYMDAIRSCEMAEGVFANEPIGVLVGCGMDRNLRLVNGSGIFDRKKFAIMDIKANYSFYRTEEESDGVEIDALDKKLEMILKTEPDGFLPIDELIEVIRDTEERRTKNEHDRIPETAQKGKG